MPVSAGNLRETGFAELWERAQVFTDLRHAPAGRPVRRLRVPRDLRRLSLPGLRDLRGLSGRGPGLRLPARRPRRRADPARGRADVRPRGPLRARPGSWPPRPGSTRSPRSPARWLSRRWRRTRAARGTGRSPPRSSPRSGAAGASPGAALHAGVRPTALTGPGDPAMATRDARYRQAAWTYVATASSTGWAVLPSPPPGSVPGGWSVAGRRGSLWARCSWSSFPWLLLRERRVVRPLGPLAAGLRARLLTLLVAIRAIEVARIAWRPSADTCPCSGSMSPCGSAPGSSASSRCSRP